MATATYIVVIRQNGYKVIGPFTSQSAEVAWVASNGGGSPEWTPTSMTLIEAKNPQVLDPGDPAASAAFQSVVYF